MAIAIYFPNRKAWKTSLRQIGHQDSKAEALCAVVKLGCLIWTWQHARIVAYFDIITFPHHSFNDYMFLQSDRSLKSLQFILENEQQTSKTKWEKMNGILHRVSVQSVILPPPSSSLSSSPSPFSLLLSPFSLLFFSVGTQVVFLLTLYSHCHAFFLQHSTSIFQLKGSIKALPALTTPMQQRGK